jgi:hypothetical protein
MKDNFIARAILENADMTKPLDRAEITMYKYTDANRFFNPELDVPVSERTVTIEDAAATLTERFENARVCALEAIGGIDNMTGEECVDVIRQYNAFVSNAKRQVYVIRQYNAFVSNAKRQVEFAVECETVDFILSPDYVRQSLRIALDCPNLNGDAE